MNTWRVILATLVIFGAGVVTGALAIRAFHTPVTPVAPAAAPDQRPRSPQPWGFNHPDFINKLDRSLDLTPSQKEKIERILRESHDRTKPLWKELGPKLHEEIALVRDQIKAQLTPEQQERYDHLMRPRRNKSDKSDKGDKSDGNHKDGKADQDFHPKSEKKPQAGCEPMYLDCFDLDWVLPTES